MTVGFVMERHVGLATFADNLRAFLADETDLVTRWYPVDYAAAGWWDRVPLPSGARAALAGRAEARRIGRDGPVDAVVFNTQVPAVLGGRAARRPLHFLCTDVTPRQYDAMAAGYDHRPDRGPAGLLKHRVNRHVFRSAACTFAWSSWVARSLVDDYGVDPARIEVIPPGVDTEAWRPRDRARGPGPLKMLFVGGDFGRKGGDAVLSAYRSLAPGTAELTIVTRSRVEAAPGVRVVDDVSANDPRLVELYASSDVFVLPSRAETFGIAYVEASASGLPVIAGRSGGVADIVVDGETGYVVPPDDTAALVDRIRRLAEAPELRDRLGSAGRRHAVEHFDGRRNAVRLAAVVRDAVGRRAPTG